MINPRKYEKTNCKNCNKEFLKYRNWQYNRPRKFCSQKCGYLYTTKKRKDETNAWKGMDAGYSAKHKWIHKYYGKADYCENNIKHNSKVFHWANLSHKYKRERSDYKSLCGRCHRIYDHIKKYGNNCKRGHPRNNKNTYITKNGNHTCRICVRISKGK